MVSCKHPPDSFEQGTPHGNHTYYDGTDRAPNYPPQSRMEKIQVPSQQKGGYVGGEQEEGFTNRLQLYTSLLPSEGSFHVVSYSETWTRPRRLFGDSHNWEGSCFTQNRRRDSTERVSRTRVLIKSPSITYPIGGFRVGSINFYSTAQRLLHIKEGFFQPQIK